MRSKLCILGVLLLAGCGLRSSIDEKEYSFDGVKLIVRGDDKPYRSNYFLQESYDLATDRRLLLRFESFSDHSKNVTVTGDNKVMVQVTLVNEQDSERATKSFHLCPLSQDWMMLATWDRAHPFSDSGNWEKQGGSFDPHSCLKRANATMAAGGTPSPAVQFDATRWYKDYPQGRGQNLGFVLVSNDKLTIFGEKSGTFSPRILFNVATTWVDWRIAPSLKVVPKGERLAPHDGAAVE
jgi:hypothetical protein